MDTEINIPSAKDTDLLITWQLNLFCVRTKIAVTCGVQILGWGGVWGGWVDVGGWRIGGGYHCCNQKRPADGNDLVFMLTSAFEHF